MYILKRPGAEDFLEKMSEIYEVVIYTASTAKYANPLLDIIDPKGYISHRLFKEHCTVLGNLTTKNLARLGRDLKNVIIIDNSPISYILQPDNAVPITTWINDKEDCELGKLIPFLSLLKNANDVRTDRKSVV